MMSWKTTAASAGTLGIFLGATAAFADVTAEEVWADWRGYMTSAGYDLQATESRAGDTLTISDLVMSFDIPEEDSSMTLAMGGMDFIDNGDGTVSIAVAPVMPISVTVGGPDGEEADIGLNYATRDLSIDVSGNPDDLTYVYSAAMAAITLEELTVEGEAVNMDEFGTVSIEIADIDGSTQMTVGELRKSTQKLTSGAISYLVDVNEPDGGDEHFMMRGGADGMDLGGTFSMPAELDTGDMALMLKQGFAVDGTFSFENGSSEFEFRENDQVVKGSSRSASGSLRVAMDNSRLAYAGSVEDMEMAMEGGDLPFPVELAMQETGFNILMPVTSGEEEQDFELGIKLRDFTMSDMIWGIVDPGGQLPRDPATIAMDVSGKVKLFLDLLNPENMETLDSGESVPGELNSLDLNNLTVRAAGAELTGKGGFTFDNSDLTTFNGLPAPTGEVNMMLVGGNALLDTLVGMGLVPEEEASGMRMMMGLFAVPGDGEDTLTSKIEVKGDGQVLANGQRIK